MLLCPVFSQFQHEHQADSAARFAFINYPAWFSCFGVTLYWAKRVRATEKQRLWGWSSGAGTSEDPVSKPCSRQVQLDQAVEGYAQKRVNMSQDRASGPLFLGLTNLTVKPVFFKIQLAFLSFQLVPCLPLLEELGCVSICTRTVPQESCRQLTPELSTPEAEQSQLLRALPSAGSQCFSYTGEPEMSTATRCSFTSANRGEGSFPPPFLLQSCSEASQPLPLIQQRVAPPQVQDMAFASAGLCEGPVGPFFQSWCCLISSPGSSCSHSYGRHRN